MTARSGAFAVSLVLSCALIASCGSAPRNGRVLLIGIDGATLRIAGPMLEQGSLPHLATLARAGVFGPLRSHFPLVSPRIWSSIATGKLPDKHGIMNFAREVAGGKRQLYESTDRKAHALWNIASDAGLTVGVVNWWTTYPPEKVNGVVVSDHLLAQELSGRRGLNRAEGGESGPIVYPPEWSERIAVLAKVEEPLTEVRDPFADPSVFPDWILPEKLSQRYRNDAAVVRIALEINRAVEPDLLMVFLPGIDRVSHRLWAGVDPPSSYPVDFGLDPEQRRAMAASLRQYYAYTDALIGRLTQHFGPNDFVMVVSDHGFEAGIKLMVLTGVHDSGKALDGMFVASGPDVTAPSEQRIVSVNDVTPTVLSWLGIPIGADMDGQPAPFLKTVAVPPIATHDTTPIEHVPHGRSGAEGAILDQLKSLGYFESGPTSEERIP